MSEQREGGTVTSLEEVFLSREFGRACDAPRPDRQPVRGSRGGITPRRSLLVRELRAVRNGRAPPIPNHSPGARRSRRRRRHPAASDVGDDSIPGDRRGQRCRGGCTGRGRRRVRRWPHRAPDRVRSGSACQRAGTAGWWGPRRAVAGPAGPERRRTRRDHGGAERDDRWGALPNSGGSAAVAASTASPVVAAPPGTSVAASPVPTGGSPSSGGSGDGSGPPAPTLPTAPTDPLAPIGASVGGTVSGLGTTVTNTVTQIASAGPPVAPVTA